jgi:TolB-like protein
MLSPDEMENVNVIGKVITNFRSTQWFHAYSKERLGKKAYERLKIVALKEYSNSDNIDVVNVIAEGHLVFWDIGLLFNYQTILAKGDVISTDATSVARAQQVKPNVAPPVEPQVKPAETRAPTTSNATSGLEEVIKRAISKLISELPNGSKIAVVNVASDDKSVTSLVIDEVEFHLVSAKRFTIIDRSTLDLIIKEQQFQVSGDVDDKDVVKIGSLSGANVVIAGSVIKSGSSNRLSLKALDVKTGQIITMARESY